jgi:divalent metal cation (Fe/Co/Zn/Cd) transporter
MVNPFDQEKVGLIPSLALPQGSDLFQERIAVTRERFRHAAILPESDIISQMTESPDLQARYLKYALGLGLFTIFYNLVEGMVSIFFGAQAEALTLFGFGIDSFIEVLSGIGIVVMVVNIRRRPGVSSSAFERTALRVTGISFFLFCAGLSVTAFYNIFTGHKPTATLPGVIISLVSILIMALLLAGKLRVGRFLRSAPLLADADCTRICIYMSLVLLASSLIYQLSGFALVDSIGAFGLIYYSFREGRESFERARLGTSADD